MISVQPADGSDIVETIEDEFKTIIYKIDASVDAKEFVFSLPSGSSRVSIIGEGLNAVATMSVFVSSEKLRNYVAYEKTEGVPLVLPVETGTSVWESTISVTGHFKLVYGKGAATAGTYYILVRY